MRITFSFLCSLMFLSASGLTAENQKGYSTNREDRTISTIDFSNNKTGEPISVDASPFMIAITPDGRTAFVTCPFENVIIPIDLATNTPEKSIEMISDKASDANDMMKRFEKFAEIKSLSPFGIAITPDGQKVYVTNAYFNNVTVIDVHTKTPLTVIPVGELPVNVAITPDGHTAYVANMDSHEITPIDITTNIPGAPIPVGRGPVWTSITPDGKMAYVTNLDSGDVTPIDLITHQPLSPIKVGAKPTYVAITLDGRWAYIANYASDFLSLIDLADNKVKESIDVQTKGAHSLGMDPDGRYVYVLMDSDVEEKIRIIDIASQKAISKVIPVGDSPCALAVVPDQAPVAEFDFTQHKKRRIIFNASASYSHVGKIDKYRWDFGDGQTTETSRPEVRHEYSKEGDYLVTLIVTNSEGTSTKQVFTGQTAIRNGGPSAMVSKTIKVHAK
jgi:YVTN family beta-propeller protein